MAELALLLIHENRYQFVVFRFNYRIGIDIDHLDIEMRHSRLAAQALQRSEHVVAQVAVVAAEQPQPW